MAFAGLYNLDAKAYLFGVVSKFKLPEQAIARATILWRKMLLEQDVSEKVAATTFLACSSVK